MEKRLNHFNADAESDVVTSLRENIKETTQYEKYHENTLRYLNSEKGKQKKKEALQRYVKTEHGREKVARWKKTYAETINGQLKLIEAQKRYSSKPDVIEAKRIKSLERYYIKKEINQLMNISLYLG